MVKRMTYRDRVHEIALDQYGYVTTADARESGIPPAELPKLAARGRLNNVAYGLYRVPSIPVTARDEYAEALLRVGAGSYLYGESVLDSFGLADVNPRTIKIATARRNRSALPAHIELVRVKPGEVTTLYEGLRSQRVAEALLACRGRIEKSRLLSAARIGRDQGFVTSSEMRKLMEQLSS